MLRHDKNENAARVQTPAAEDHIPNITPVEIQETEQLTSSEFGINNLPPEIVAIILNFQTTGKLLQFVVATNLYEIALSIVCKKTGATDFDNFKNRMLPLEEDEIGFNDCSDDENDNNKKWLQDFVLDGLYTLSMAELVQTLLHLKADERRQLLFTDEQINSMKNPEYINYLVTDMNGIFLYVEGLITLETIDKMPSQGYLEQLFKDNGLNALRKRFLTAEFASKLEFDQLAFYLSNKGMVECKLESVERAYQFFHKEMQKEIIILRPEMVKILFSDDVKMSKDQLEGLICLVAAIESKHKKHELRIKDFDSLSDIPDTCYVYRDYCSDSSHDTSFRITLPKIKETALRALTSTNRWELIMKIFRISGIELILTQGYFSEADVDPLINKQIPFAYYKNHINEFRNLQHHLLRSLIVDGFFLYKHIEKFSYELLLLTSIAIYGKFVQPDEIVRIYESNPNKLCGFIKSKLNYKALELFEKSKDLFRNLQKPLSDNDYDYYYSSERINFIEECFRIYITPDYESVAQNKACVFGDDSRKQYKQIIRSILSKDRYNNFDERKLYEFINELLIQGINISTVERGELHAILTVTSVLLGANVFSPRLKNELVELNNHENSCRPVSSSRL